VAVAVFRKNSTHEYCCDKTVVRYNNTAVILAQ